MLPARQTYDDIAAIAYDSLLNFMVKAELNPGAQERILNLLIDGMEECNDEPDQLAFLMQASHFVVAMQVQAKKGARP